MLPGGVPGNLGSGATVCHMLAKRGSKAGGESRSDRLLGPEGGGGAHRESSSSVGGERLEREGVVGAFHKSAFSCKKLQKVRLFHNGRETKDDEPPRLIYAIHQTVGHQRLYTRARHHLQAPSADVPRPDIS